MHLSSVCLPTHLFVEFAGDQGEKLMAGVAPLVVSFSSVVTVIGVYTVSY
jgi:hypothetical protein